MAEKKLLLFVNMITFNFKKLMMKSIFIAPLFLVILVSCENTNKNTDKSTVVVAEQTSVYESLADTLEQMSKDILSSIKTNNYASFSNYLSSEDTVVNLFEKQAKEEGISNEKLAQVKGYFDSSYSKLIIKTKKNFDYIIKKGTQQGIIWNDVKFDRTEWKLSKEKDWVGSSSSLNLELTINFKYKGIQHFIRFNGEAFTLIGSKWLLMNDFYLDSFSAPEQTEQVPNNNDNATEESSTDDSTK